MEEQGCRFTLICLLGAGCQLNQDVFRRVLWRSQQTTWYNVPHLWVWNHHLVQVSGKTTLHIISGFKCAASSQCSWPCKLQCSPGPVYVSLYIFQIIRDIFLNCYIIQNSLSHKSKINQTLESHLVDDSIQTMYHHMYRTFWVKGLCRIMKTHVIWWLNMCSLDTLFNNF